ncbi:MAG: carboxypeptidase-like regulatory domain-containing protein [bacterium]|nr:carboxypeptidase-like regulatory domain-containing protein [bacterium]
MIPGKGETMRPLFSLLTALVILSGSAQAATVGRIQGTILDSKTQKPVSGATVQLEDTGRSVISDENGAYLFLSLDPDAYTLIVTREGYNTWRKRNIMVQADFGTLLHVPLEKMPEPATGAYTRPGPLVILAIVLLMAIWQTLRFFRQNRHPQTSDM